MIVDRITNYFAFTRAAASRLLEEHQRAPYDVVYGIGLGAWGYARAVPSSSPEYTPLVVCNHGMEEFVTPHPVKRVLYGPFRMAIRASSRAAAAVVVDDEQAAGDLVDRLGFTPARVERIPIGIDLAAIDSAGTDGAREERSGGPFLLLVGRLEANKGFDVAIDALARVAERLPATWEAVLVGAGSQRAALQRKARQAGLVDRLRFAGALSERELGLLFERAHLFVHPTLYEGGSIVTLEAMAHGLAVIATRVGGIPNKISDGENGILVEPGNAEALGREIARLASDPELRLSLGANARRTVEERFDWAAVAELLLALFADLAGETPHVPA